ncbi:ABC transporter permease subunit [Lignipirellula cremea]|uniref:ABC-2 family transporter protein n=1 Tax=Lignipirellula cremea TaxID=2528010 RepID=A0A518DZS7_9BACT|nr:ABC transporter permease subunit [Lignipirellula cremea]QDU97346.1 ABC-2 family transporter protein [Lignipirellula cremea]
MFVGPVFTREAAVAPRRSRFFLLRSVYVGALLLLMCTGWMVMAGTQIISNIGDMARFGSILFGILAPIQLAFVLFFSALGAASSVAQEKDRKTFILLLMTRMSNSELVLGKLFASLLNIYVMVFAALPIFMLIVLLGGVSFSQVARVYAVTVATALAAGSLGSLLALWREKTFQTLSITALILMFWLGLWEAIGSGAFGESWSGVSTEMLSIAFSPIRAILSAIRPAAGASLGDAAGATWLATARLWFGGVGLFMLFSLLGAVLLNGVAIALVRVWNPTRETRPQQAQAGQESIWGEKPETLDETQKQSRAEQARAGHVDARRGAGERLATRAVWNNPILWREVCTWAYGRKVMIIRAAYLILFLMAAAGLYFVVTTHSGDPGEGLAAIIPPAARPLAPFFLLSLMIINALAVTSITNERDGRSLDLLLVTDLSPSEFVFGKIGGVLWITKEMVLAPLALSIYLYISGGLTGQNLAYLIIGMLVMDLFVTMLGIHCGGIYANSRSAIGVSLGTLFFLFLGVMTCLLIMISFRGSFQTQLAPFLAIILGGGVGLFVSLGARNPSSAIATASLLLPFATFYAITSFLLGQYTPMFLVLVFVYGFTTTALLMPALGEFNMAMGWSRTEQD